MTKEEAPKEEVQPINEWEDDYDAKDLAIPYSREDVKEEDKQEPETEQEEENEEDIPEAPELEQTVTLEDPGNYEAKDYSFDYTIDGKSYKIVNSEDVDKIPDEDLEKLKASELSSLIRRANLIDTKHDKDEEEFNKKKDAYSEQSQEEQNRVDTTIRLAAEFDYLESKGHIPPVPEELQDKDWTSPKIASREGVKERKEILDYMHKENVQRAKLGLKPIDSVLDAFNAFSLENNRKVDQERTKQAGEARKAAGSRVSAPTNNQPASMVPKGIAVGRTNVFRNSNVDWT